MPLSTDDILTLALELSGFEEPPPDTAIYVPGEGVRRILVGIDVGTAELLLARRLGFDLVIAHHPAGGEALRRFPEVLERQVELMLREGVPEGVAREAVAERIHDARCQAHAANDDRAPAAARLLGIPFMNIHLPLDEIGRRRMVEVVAGLPAGAVVDDLVARLTASLPEFRAAGTRIQVRVGDGSNTAGRTAVLHAAGTNGGYSVARALFQHGIDTVVYIHCSGPETRRLRDAYRDRGKNLVVTGHMAGDSLGINPFVDALERHGMEVVCMSGIVRAPGEEDSG